MFRLLVRWPTRLLIALFSLSLLPVAAQKIRPKVHSTPTTRAVPKKEPLNEGLASVPPDTLASAKQLAQYLQVHFQTDQERVKALYWWLARNVQYDVENMYAFEMTLDSAKTVADLFTRRKAICSGYAETFRAVCQQVGIRCYVITGYTKHGKTLASVPHAWNAAQLNGQWYLFDPTWGAGGVTSNHTFEAMPNEVFYQVVPGEFIPTHMPFDPLWQFADHPISHSDFMNGKLKADAATPYFNFQDSLRVYEGQSEPERLEAEARRIERSGVRNDLTFSYLRSLKQVIQVIHYNNTVDKQNALTAQYNSAVALYNQILKQINAFIDYRNRQFRPELPEATVRATLDSVASGLTRTRSTLAIIEKEGEPYQANIEQFRTALAEIDKNLAQQQLFINKYYSTPRALRRVLLFVK